MKHRIPLETHVSCSSSPGEVYIVTDYQDVHGPCAADCDLDHDCYKEAFIMVRREVRFAMPLAHLNLIFDPITHMGRKATKLERTPLP